MCVGTTTTSFYYHGSPVSGIKELEPRKGSTPGNEQNSPKCVYATDDPACAAAHAFRWPEEGIDLYYGVDEDDDKKIIRVHLAVPEDIYMMLNQPVSIYAVDREGFTFVKADTLKRTYRNLWPVKCLTETRFSTVVEAVTHFGGRVLKTSIDFVS